MQIENFFAESKTLLPHPDISNLIKENLHIRITFLRTIINMFIQVIFPKYYYMFRFTNYYSMSENRPFCNVR